MNPSAQNILAIILGIAVAALVALILFPLVEMGFAQTISISPDRKAEVNNLGFTMVEFFWLAIASLVGGFITSWIAVSRKVFCSLVMGFLLFLILYITEMRMMEEFDLSYLFIDFAAIAFSLCGGLIRKYIELGREYENI